MVPTAAPILSAKISVPPVRPPLVLRRHLHERLNQGLQCKLTLVSAPAGYGKTTLLAEWAASAPLPTAWLSLDVEDNTPGDFCAYFWAALNRVVDAPGWPEVAALADLPPQAALQRLLLSLEQAVQPLVLVLDDYHVIRSPEIHQALAAFLDHLPPYIHLFIATRKDPPVPLARLRAQGELVEVRSEHLRFSTVESAEFLDQKMGLRLSPEDIAALTQRTEGWAVGLQLAALSLLEQPEPHPFIEALSGNHPFILDYLVEEVLNTQPAQIQKFLLHTSLLRRLSAPLCAALTSSGLPAAAENLAYLERGNLFLAPLDPAHQWFRYHHLFADLLRRRLLEIEGPDMVSALHMRAANWYHQAGEPVEAIHHALASQDWPAAAQMMVDWSTEFFKTGALGTYLPMLAALPDEELHRHPQLIQDLGWGLALTNDLEQADHYLRLAEAAQPDQPNFLGETLAGRAYVACFQFDLEKTLAMGRRALELLDPDYDWMRSVVSMVMGLAHWYTGNPPETQQAMHTALREAQRSNSPRVEKLALAYLGRTKALEMDFLAAEEMALNAIGVDPHPQLSPGNDVPALDLAAVYYEWNDLPAAERYLALGMAANDASRNWLTRVAGLRIAARLHLAQGQAEEAWKAAQQAVQLTTEVGLAPFFQNLNAACCVEIALGHGDLELAADWAGRISPAEGLDAFHPLPRLAQARVFISRRQPQDALRILAELEPLTDSPAWRFARFRLRLLQALADPQNASSWLTQDLPTALRQKLVRSYVDLGQPMAELMKLLSPPEDASLADRFTALLDAFPESSRVPDEPLDSGTGSLPPLIEPLSERELDVVRAMAAGLGTREIAARLVVAESTVRSHIKNIFAKLEVHSRLQAVQQARRRRLI